MSPDDIHRGAPHHIKQTYSSLIRELDRKQSMIDDLERLANDNDGLCDEDCALLACTVEDRDHVKNCLTSLKALFS